jgi:hypothetical protein
MTEETSRKRKRTETNASKNDGKNVPEKKKGKQKITEKETEQEETERPPETEEEFRDFVEDMFRIVGQDVVEGFRAMRAEIRDLKRLVRELVDEKRKGKGKGKDGKKKM